MTKEEYSNFALRYKGCGACFPMYHTLSRFEKMWFSAIQKDVAELEKENALLKGRNEDFELQIMGLLIKYEEVYKRFPDLKSAMDKAKEVSKENAELKGIKDVATLIRANNDTVITLMQLNNMLVSKSQQLTNAKELLKKWVELYKPKLEGYPITPIQEQTEQFLNSEVEK